MQLDVGLVASDIEAMLHFYTELLGLEPTDSAQLPGNRTLHRLRCGDGLVKLQEYHDGPPALGPRGLAAQAGVRYFTIRLSGLPALAERLEAAGVEFARPLVEYQPGVWNCMVVDPDGNTIELHDAG